MSFFTSRSVGSAVRKAGRAASKARSTARDKEDLTTLLAKHAELSRELQTALAEAAAASDPATMPLESVVNKPKKTGITVHLCAVAWRAD
jgi:hypothetical protein